MYYHLLTAFTRSKEFWESFTIPHLITGKDVVLTISLVIRVNKKSIHVASELILVFQSSKDCNSLQKNLRIHESIFEHD